MDQKLKPCPFCGSPAQLCEHRSRFFLITKSTYWVRCSYRKCKMMLRTPDNESKEEAIGIWNNREKVNNNNNKNNQLDYFNENE